MIRTLTTTLLLLSAATAGAQADHLQCFKIRDSVQKTTYAATLAPTDNTFPVAAGCVVRMPAKLLCVPVVKTITGGNPPGSDPGQPAQKYLCYKVKCPKTTPAATIEDQFGVHQVTVRSTGLLCAPEAAPTTTTVTSTSTTTTGCSNVDTDADGYFALPCGNDCNDLDAQINPGHAEICNGSDDTCNGSVDEGLGSTTCGTGACQTTVSNCMSGQPQTCTPLTGGPEMCANEIDDDCDGSTDEQPCQCTTNGQCPGAPNATGVCQGVACGGTCTIQCNDGFGNCNALDGDGCEVDTTTSQQHCGTCGNACSYPNSSAACLNGFCFLIQCNFTHANCDFDNANGCETPILNDPANCGACNYACPPETPTCFVGGCQ